MGIVLNDYIATGFAIVFSLMVYCSYVLEMPCQLDRVVGILRSVVLSEHRSHYGHQALKSSFFHWFQSWLDAADLVPHLTMNALSSTCADCMTWPKYALDGNSHKRRAVHRMIKSSNNGLGKLPAMSSGQRRKRPIPQTNGRLRCIRFNGIS